MNKTTSLSIVASLALLVIPAETAFASEVNAKDSAQTLRKHVATKQVRISQPGSDRMLNPQPLPPGKTFKTTGKFVSDRMLNPQPLPPKDAGLSQRGIIIVGGKGQFGSDRMLNPQPLPPKARTTVLAGYGSDRMLNPQPLPPKDKTAAFKSYGSDRMLNPQPLPPKATVAVMKNYGSDRSLNPQPLPPKETLKLMVR
jgi:hypothetical protein